MANMHVGFYGHVRQYHNLKEDIDKAISEVLESGQYVLGPALERFEGELAMLWELVRATRLSPSPIPSLLLLKPSGLPGPGSSLLILTRRPTI